MVSREFANWILEDIFSSSFDTLLDLKYNDILLTLEISILNSLILKYIKLV